MQGGRTASLCSLECVVRRLGGIASAGEENDGKEDERDRKLKKWNENEIQATHVAGVVVEHGGNVDRCGPSGRRKGDNERRQRPAWRPRQSARGEQDGRRNERRNGNEECRTVAGLQQGHERHDRSDDEHCDGNGVEFHWPL